MVSPSTSASTSTSTATSRIALLQPRIPDGNYLPGLGIMYLAGLLLRDGHDVRVFDENIQTDIEKEIVAFSPQILGISCVTAALGPAVRLAEGIKKRLPQTIVVAGGPHITIMPTETLNNHPVIDYGFVGEAERSFPAFCRLVLADAPDHEAIAALRGLAFRQNGRATFNRNVDYLSNEELDALPYPPWHLLPVERIFKHATHGLFTRGKRIMPIMTSRGCPHYCAFCCRTMGFKFRTRSTESIIGEIKWLHETYGIDELYFEDDTFTQDADRAHQLLDAIIDLKLGLHIKFANGLRADLVDRSLLQKMKKAGVYWVGFGIESGAAHTQELMMKRLDLGQAAENVCMAKKMGFKVGSSCIIGYPGETREDVTESIKYFAKLPLDSFAIVPCVPFPGTTARMICEREGWLTERAGNYDNYWFEIFRVNPLIDTPHLPAAEMKKIIRRVYYRFYLLNPRRFATVAKVYIRKARAALSRTSWLRMLRSGMTSSPQKSGAEYAG